MSSSRTSSFNRIGSAPIRRRSSSSSSFQQPLQNATSLGMSLGAVSNEATSSSHTPTAGKGVPTPRYSVSDLAGLRELYDAPAGSSGTRAAAAQQRALDAATPASEQGSDCTVTSSIYKPSRPSTARTVTSAVSNLRNVSNNPRCLSAQTARLNNRLRVNSAASERKEQKQRPSTADACKQKKTTPNQNIFLTATARYRQSMSCETTAPKTAIPHPPNQQQGKSNSGRGAKNATQTATTTQKTSVDLKVAAGGAFARMANQCDSALEGLRHLQLQMSDPEAAAQYQAQLKREIRREDRAAAVAAMDGDLTAMESTVAFGLEGAEDSASSTTAPLDHDEQALAELHKDEDLGYNRFFVSGNTINKRISAKLDHYRRNPEELEHLQARVERRKRQHRQKLRDEFLDTLQKQREKRIGRVHQSYERSTAAESKAMEASVPQSPTRSPLRNRATSPRSTRKENDVAHPTFVPLSDDDEDVAPTSPTTGVSAAAGGITAALPYFKQYQQQQDQFGSVGFRQVRTYDQLVQHNNTRWQEGRRAYVQALKEKRDRTVKVISRHDEIVAKANEERRKEALAAVVADWLVITKLQQSAMAIHRIMTMLGCTRQGLDVYRTMRGYFLKWFQPAQRKLDALRLCRLRGKILFGLCAARMFAHIEVRRRSVKTLILFGNHLQSAGSFKVGLTRFRHYLVICQRIVRQFLFHRRRRLQLLMMQWARVEEPVRKAAEIQQRQDAARKRREQDQRRAFMSSKALKAEKEKALKARKTMSKDQLVALKVKEILDTDPFDFTQQIPFRLKLEVLGEFWTQRRVRFYKYDMPAQFVAERQAYQRKLEQYELEKLAGRATSLKKPQPPKKKEFPLFFPHHVMEKLVRSTLQSMQEISMDMKQHAATQVVTMPDLGLRYHVLKDNLFVQRFGLDGQQRMVNADWREKK